MVFSWTYTPYALLLFIGAAILLTTSAMAWRRRHVPGALYLAFVGIALSISSVAYGIELGASDVAVVRLMYKLYYVGSQAAGVLIPLMLLDFLGRRDLITRRTVILLSVIPAVSLALALTNDWHQLIWHHIRIDRSLGYTVTSFDRGLLYFLPNGNGLVLILVMLIVLARAWHQAASGHRVVIGLMMLGILLPELSFVVYLIGFEPIGLTLDTYFYSVSAVIFALGMFGRKLFEVPPIMHRSIYRILPNGIFIFDSHGRLADINPAAASARRHRRCSGRGRALSRSTTSLPTPTASSGSSSMGRSAACRSGHSGCAATAARLPATPWSCAISPGRSEPKRRCGSPTCGC